MKGAGACGLGALEARSVELERGGRPVLRGVSLAVAPGTHTVLVGPNGSGKTSLLLALKGVLGPTAGAVLLDGERVEGPVAEVGVVLASPEDQGVSPVVEDDIAFGLEARGVEPARIRQRVDAALQAVGLVGVRSWPYTALSGGQAQRAAMASVLALGARFLLLDEATAMLSPSDRTAFLVRVARLVDEGVGVLHVTHRPEEVLWGERVVALEAGRIRFEGPPERFFAWTGCPWPRPVWAAVADELRRQGVVSPSLPALARWLEAPP